jgi:hypothetical protein
VAVARRTVGVRMDRCKRARRRRRCAAFLRAPHKTSRRRPADTRRAPALLGFDVHSHAFILAPWRASVSAGLLGPVLFGALSAALLLGLIQRESYGKARRREGWTEKGLNLSVFSPSRSNALVRPENRDRKGQRCAWMRARSGAAQCFSLSVYWR